MDDKQKNAKILDFIASRNAALPPTVEIVRGTDIPMEPIDWIWRGWLAGKKLHILAGAPGTGKTTIAISMAATISRGGAWPDNTISPVGDVLIWSGEDDPADTLIPRLVAAGANLHHLYVVGQTYDGDGTGRRAFDPATDMPGLIESAWQIPRLKLLIVDPIVSCIRGDSHKNAETRRGLQPLIEFAAATGAALIGITHLAKGTQGRDPLERLAGSLAFGAAARIVWGTVADNSTEEGAKKTRKFVRIKTNAREEGGGYDYCVHGVEIEAGIEAGRVEWGSAFDGAATDVFDGCDAQPHGPEGKSAVSEAAEWLEDYLADGGRPALDVFSAAARDGHKKITLKRAKAKIGVESIKCHSGGWQWQLKKFSFSNK